jgi:hypothetical protein
MPKKLTSATILLTVIIALSVGISIPIHAQNQQKALILSSLEKYQPTQYLDRVARYLTDDGYTVTVMKDTQVTLNFLTTQLNNYDVVFWRTNVYEWHHVTYWYVGELTNKATMQAYSGDVANGNVDDTNAILGVDMNFLFKHFPTGSLNHVKLAVLTGSSSANIAAVFIGAGVKGTVDYYQSVSLAFGETDGITTIVVSYLTSGVSLQNAVWQTLIPFISQQINGGPDPGEASQIPPIWYMGNGTLTIP